MMPDPGRARIANVNKLWKVTIFPETGARRWNLRGRGLFRSRHSTGGPFPILELGSLVDLVRSGGDFRSFKALKMSNRQRISVRGIPRQGPGNVTVPPAA